jgi:hypothetical protein
MESQVEHGGIAKSRIPAVRKKRLCEDRLVDPEDVLYAGNHERPVKPQQLLVSWPAIIPLRRRHQVILNEDFWQRRDRVVGLIRQVGGPSRAWEICHARIGLWSPCALSPCGRSEEDKADGGKQSSQCTPRIGGEQSQKLPVNV